MRDRAATLWWLHPAAVFALPCLAIGWAAYVVPPRIYALYWRTSKQFDRPTLFATLACAAVFSLFSWSGQAARTRRAEHVGADTAWADRIPWKLLHHLFQASFYLCLLGYAVWIVAAIRQGASAALVQQVITGDKGAVYALKEQYLLTVSGLTTLTECGIPAMILGGVLGVAQGFVTVRKKLGLILVLAFVRAFLNAERLAIIGLLVPFLVLWINLRYLSRGPLSPAARRFFRLAPVGAVALLLVVFTGFEYFRSWNGFYAESGQYSLAEFGATRMAGYYITSFNNGAFLISKSHITLGAPYYTLRCLWTFPVVSAFVHELFPRLAFDAPLTFVWILESGGVNPEFNSPDGVLDPVVDFGLAGGLLYWAAAGWICGLVYALYQQRHPAGLCLYPFLYLGLLEMPLAMYWSEGKSLPVYGVLLTSVLLIQLHRRLKTGRFNTGPLSVADLGRAS